MFVGKKRFLFIESPSSHCSGGGTAGARGYLIVGAVWTLGEPGEGFAPECAARRGAKRARTLIEQETARSKIEPRQEIESKREKHTRIYPASGLTCCDNTPTAAFVLFISQDLDRELQSCSSHWGFGGEEEL